MRKIVLFILMCLTINANAQQMFAGIDVTGLSYNELCKRMTLKGYKLDLKTSDCSVYKKIPFESFPECQIIINSLKEKISNIEVIIEDCKKNNKVHSNPFIWLSNKFESQYGKCQEEKNDGYYMLKSWSNTPFAKITLIQSSGISKSPTSIIYYPR